MRPIRTLKPSSTATVNWRRSLGIVSGTKTPARQRITRRPCRGPFPWVRRLTITPWAILGTLTCTTQLSSGIMSFITRLWPRRLAIVDEQKGLVFAFPMFQHRGAVHDIQIKGVPGVDVVHMNGGTSNLQAGEIFKIRGSRSTKSKRWA